MGRRGRYYLGRAIKGGRLTQELLVSAMLRSPVLRIGKFSWTIIDVQQSKDEKFQYIFGRLAKFSAEGHIAVVDPNEKVHRDAKASNLLVASSPFVYLPSFSGFAYMHVWNDIQDDLFPRRIKQLVEHAYDKFFVDCAIEPIVDYRAFAAKLKGITRYTELIARINPPNPLFGKLWEPLKEYLKTRNTSELSFREVGNSGEGVRTEIPRYVEGILTGAFGEEKKIPDITDAAMLMAADGYGTGKIVGEANNEEIVIRTAESQKSFLADKDPKPDDLAHKAYKHFAAINKERHMEH